jgi:hypothetical protein
MRPTPLEEGEAGGEQHQGSLVFVGGANDTTTTCVLATDGNGKEGDRQEEAEGTCVARASSIGRRMPEDFQFFEVFDLLLNGRIYAIYLFSLK